MLRHCQVLVESLVPWRAIVAAFILCASNTACRTTNPPRPVTVSDLIQQSLDASDRSRQVAITSAETRCTEEFCEFDSPPLHPGSKDLNIVDLEIVPGLLNAEMPKVSEEFLETDVREALLMLVEDSGFDLVLDEKISGVVNTTISDLPLDQAIEKILMPLGYVVALRGKQFIVAQSDPKSPLFSYVAQSLEYRPLHVEPKTLMATVPTNMTQYVKLIEGSNLLMIEAPARLGNEIVKRFHSVDQPIPQVVLEAIICVVSPDTGFQLGLDWQHAVELNGKTALKLGASGLALNGSFSKPGLESVFTDFATTSAFVKLLCEHGYLTIRASPHVMAKDGEKANISISRETFFAVQPIAAGADNANSAFFVQQNIQKVEAGITLDITPRIRGDLVTIQIEKAEVSEDIRNANTELALNPYPIINRRSVSTTVHVKDGRTIVIGGLVQRETVDRVNRVPGLSRVPLIGYLFESKQSQTREADVVIFISPRIVKPSPMD